MAGAIVAPSLSGGIIMELEAPFPTASTISTDIKQEMSTVSMSTSAQTVSASTSTSTPSASEVHRGSAWTINYGDFSTLLNPKNLESCICCNSSLINHTPPSMFVGKKTEILKSFCDILNLPFNLMMQPQNNPNFSSSTCHNNSSSSTFYNSNVHLQCDEDDGEESRIDFPFCFHCTNNKVIKLTDMYDKLQVVQDHYDKLKEAIMKDILRVFISNMVLENNVQLNTVRERNTHDRMFQMLRRHSERKSRKMTDQEAQTDITSVKTSLSVATSLTATSLSGENYSYNNSTNSKRRKIATRKSESHHERAVTRRGSNLSHNYSHHHQHYQSVTPPVSESTNAPEILSSFDPNCSMNNSSPEPYNPNGNIYSENFHNGRNLSHHQSDESASMENVMNGVMFTMDDNGLLGLGEDYLNSVDFHNFEKDSGTINGYPSFDHATLSDEFHSVLGLVDGLETDGSMSVEVPMEPVTARKSSPRKNSSGELNEGQVVMLSDSKIRISTRGVKANCKICDKLISKSGMKQHLDEMHGDEKPHKCRGCDKRFARRDHHAQHEERHIINSKRNYYCHRCGEDSEMITSKYAYIDHCVKVHGIEDDVVEYFHYCDGEDCYESFKVREDFLNHLKTHWKKGSSFKCKVCDKMFAGKKRFETHKLEAHKSNEPYYDCQFCHWGFEEEDDYTRHTMFHRVKIPEERTHACDICGKAFETANRLRCHKYNVHTSKKGREKPEKVSLPASSVPSPCQNSHLSQPESVASPQATTDAKDKSELICLICGKGYTHKKRFEKHLLKHKSKEVPENNCHPEEEEGDEEKDADIAEDPGDHSDQDFEVGNGLQCRFCPKKHKTKHEVRRHMAAKHRSKYVKGLQKHCVVCWHVFKNKDELQEHYDEKHSKYKCQECGKQFSSTLLLNQHMKRHSPDLPYACKICKERFTIERVLKMHSKRVHGKVLNNADTESEEEEDLQELENTLSPVNHLLNHEGDGDSYDMLDLFQL